MRNQVTKRTLRIILRRFHKRSFPRQAYQYTLWFQLGVRLRKLTERRAFAAPTADTVSRSQRQSALHCLVRINGQFQPLAKCDPRKATILNQCIKVAGNHIEDNVCVALTLYHGGTSGLP